MNFKKALSLDGKINASMTPSQMYKVVDQEYLIGVMPEGAKERPSKQDLIDVIKVPAYSVLPLAATWLVGGPLAFGGLFAGIMGYVILDATRPQREGYLLCPPTSDEVSIFDDEPEVKAIPEHEVGAIQLANALSAYGITCDLFDEEGGRIDSCDIYLESLEDGGARIDVYQIKTKPGFKISLVEKLGADFARDLKLPEGSVVTVDSNIGGGRAALYLPKPKTHDVKTMNLLKATEQSGYVMPGLVGESSTGQLMVVDIAAGVHWKVCGTTGSGKSVQIMNMALSAMYAMPPELLKVTAIDMKRVDLPMLNGLPHMTGRAIVDPYQALKALQDIREDMDKRLELFERSGVRNITGFNKSFPAKAIPYHLLIIEELLLLVSSKLPIMEENDKGEERQVSTVGKEVELLMVHFSVASRASGIHMIYGIQRPDSKALDGQILSNTPSAIGMQTTTGEGSKMIIGDHRCKDLMGAGDCFVKESSNRATRAQSAFATDDDIAMIGAAIQQKWAVKAVAA